MRPLRPVTATAIALLWLTTVLPAWGADDAAQFPPEQIEFFEKQVRPIFAEHCHKCHSAEKHKGGLTLDSRENLLKGGDTGPAIVPGKPADSELVRAVGYDPDGYQMPPDGKLPDELIATLTKWVEIGAPWPESKSAATAGPAEFNLEERAERWSFQPLKRVTPPAVQNAQWPRTPIDRFLLGQLEATGLQPATETDHRTWLRRAYLDTIGLPPTPSDVAEFVADKSPEAYARVVERLLASPHFGERWGRHWLDLVRYAETRGHEFDYDVPNAWHFRDYVIRALNDDVPYDRFVVEHVAGDLLEDHERLSDSRENNIPDDAHSSINSGMKASFTARHASGHELPTPPFHSFGFTLDESRFPLRLHPATGVNESLIATGFWHFGEAIHSPVDIRQEEADRFENMIDVYAKTFLGLTVACARCHDHKFDPITQKDFYALQGYLQSSSYRQAAIEAMEENRRIAEQLNDNDERRQRAALERFMRTAEPILRKVDQYLLAAREVLQSSRANQASGRHMERATATPESGRELKRVSHERELDPQRLAAWVEHLRSVRDDHTDPFYLWASSAMGEFDLAAIQQTARRILDQLEVEEDGDSWRNDVKQRRAIAASQFLPDSFGFRFPTNSLPLVLFGESPEQPLAGFSVEYAVEWDRAWDVSADHPDLMRDPARIASWLRAGRTLRTPTFNIDRDKLFVLLRGGANAYLAVDSHILINGPLHGQLLREYPHAAGWRWEALDVSRYRGHRAHLELSTRPGEDFGVGAVWLRDAPPMSPPSAARSCASLIAFDIARAEDASIGDVATIYEEVFRAAVIQLIQYFDRSAQYGGRVPEAEWMISHPELFGLSSEAARSAFSEDCVTLYEQRRRLIERIQPISATAPAMLDGYGEDEYVFIRGNWKKPGDTVPRRFLEVFHGYGPASRDSRSARIGGSGRLALAAQMVHPDQTPILPRVIVNRIWQHYFGRGIVPTPDDFGYMGQDPSHPELLDWLATELVAHDWSLKHIHRLILLSAAYRMESRVEGHGPRVKGQEPGSGVAVASLDPQPSSLDPNNVLLHRMNIKRLEGEIIRDQILAASGRLDDRLYGKSVPVHLTPFMEGRGRPGVSGSVDGEGRRSVYIAVRRNFPDPFFQAFDFPNPHSSVGRRSVSNVPAQALALMNNPFVVDQARVWAERLLHESPGATAEERIDRLCRHAFGRAPTEEELASGVEFVRLQAAEYNGDEGDPRVWADFCHVLMNVKEFVFVQ